MLKELIIHQIILVETCHIHFTAGFNVLSGETGAGKSAILHAIRLISGERADTSVIRKGEDKGSVQALFSIDRLPGVTHFLQEAGIDHSPDELLIVKREIHKTGKSRAFVNQQPVQISFLKQLGESLLESVGQGESYRLLNCDTQRVVLDLFGNITFDVKLFSEQFSLEKSLETEIEELKTIQSEKLKKSEASRQALAEIEEAAIEEGEEERLFKEYSELINREEFLQTAEKAQKELHECVYQGLSNLSRTFQSLVKLDETLSSSEILIQSATKELQELDHEIAKRISHSLDSEQKIDVISERLRQINTLKKKYGGEIHTLLSTREKIHSMLEGIEKRETEIEKCEKNLLSLKESNDQLANKITLMREKAARDFEKELKDELATLNMGQAHIEIRVSPQARSRYGDTHVEIYLAPNKGEKLLPLKMCASGGELSRVLLAIQTKLSSKYFTPTLIFDEIDSNIGGVTAAIIGQKLKALGEHHQILSVTHFPQVAEVADTHFHIYKIENQGRTYSLIEELNPTSRKKELERMAGV